MNEPWEIYSLRLDHYIQDKSGRHAIDEPLVVRMVYDRSYTPMSICINGMLEKMRKEVLSRTTNVEEELEEL